MHVQLKAVVRGAAGNMDFNNAVEPQARERRVRIEPEIHGVAVKVIQVQQQATAGTLSQVIEKGYFVTPAIAGQVRQVVGEILQQERRAVTRAERLRAWRQQRQRLFSKRQRQRHACMQWATGGVGGQQ